MNSVKIVEEFWDRVWKARNPAKIDDLVVDDFVLATGGVEVVSRTKFKEWAAAFMANIVSPDYSRTRICGGIFFGEGPTPSMFAGALDLLTGTAEAHIRFA